MPVPVVIVGNITVGGNGKTPLVAWVARALQERGWRPGIVSRGYGGRQKGGAQEVTRDSDPEEVGDEPCLLLRRTGLPVAVGIQRAAAARLLLERHGCTCLIADDGLQHYSLGRDLEIVVTDRVRGLGNGRCLPAGPLREPIERLAEIKLKVAYGPPVVGEYSMVLEPTEVRSLVDNGLATLSLTGLAGLKVHGVAGIGHPARFFQTLRDLGLTVIEHPFPDHYRYSPTDLIFDDEFPVIMTEKDATKCLRFGRPGQWYLTVEARLPTEFREHLVQLLEDCCADKRGSSVAVPPVS